MATLLLKGGYSEAEVRERSLDWIRDTAKAVERRERAGHANHLQLLLMAAYAPWSEGGGEAAQEALGQLMAEDEDQALSHLLNPNAQTDWETLRSSGLVQRVPAAKEDTPHAGQG